MTAATTRYRALPGRRSVSIVGTLHSARQGHRHRAGEIAGDRPLPTLAAIEVQNARLLLVDVDSFIAVIFLIVQHALAR